MPDKRSHRGPHPSDAALFAAEKLPPLREALADFSLLLSKGYAGKSALKLVGDRFALTQRQRLAVMRSACSDQQRQSRLSRRVEIDELPGRTLAIDGYNLLITIEAALSGGLIFRGRDGCFRDLASIHGTYRKVDETIDALTLIGTVLAEIGRSRVEGVPPSNRGQDARDTNTPRALWLLDSPVSNSGRLKTLITNLARDHRWPWHVRLSINPDAELRAPLTVPKQVGWASAHAVSATDPSPIVVTTDSVILDTCPRWTNLAAEIITRRLPAAPVIDLGRS